MSEFFILLHFSTTQYRMEYPSIQSLAKQSTHTSPRVSRNTHDLGLLETISLYLFHSMEMRREFSLERKWNHLVFVTERLVRVERFVIFPGTGFGGVFLSCFENALLLQRSNGCLLMLLSVLLACNSLIRTCQLTYFIIY